jgi:RNA polymerase-interacting CarD/CdnL/TRCF family regulator
MTFMIGDKVVYPSQGPCLIGAVVMRTIAGAPTRFYPLSFLDNSGDMVLVPVDKLSALPIRPLLAKSEVPKLLRHFKKTTVTEKNWRQRDIDNARLLSSGSAFDLAEVVESLTGLSATKTLRPHDRQVLERAKRNLVCEISEVTGATMEKAAEQVDEALKMRKRA